MERHADMQPNIRQNSGNSVEEEEKGLQEPQGPSTTQENSQNQPNSDISQQRLNRHLRRLHGMDPYIVCIYIYYNYVA